MPTEMEFVNYKEFVENLPEATEYASGDKAVISNANDGTRQMPENTAEFIQAQKTLAGNVAPPFVENSTSALAGHLYSWEGKIYVAKYNYNGSWDASKFNEFDVAEILSNNDKLLHVSYENTWVDGYNVAIGNYEVGDVVDLTPEAVATYRYMSLSVKEGDTVVLTARGGSNPRAYGILDADNRLLAKTYNNANLVNYRVNIPARASKIIINAVTSYTPSVLLAVRLVDNELTKSVSDVRDLESITSNTSWTYGKAVSLGDVGDTIDVAGTSASGYQFNVVSVNEGDLIAVECKSSTTYGTFGFLDANNKLISKESSNIYTKKVVSAPSGAAYVVVNNLFTSNAARVTKKTTGTNVLVPEIVAVEGLKKNDVWTLGYINLISYAVGDTVSLTPTSSNYYEFLALDVKGYDVVCLTTQGGGQPRAYAFIDSSNKLIEKAGDSLNLVDKRLLVPSNAAKIIVNNTKSNTARYVVVKSKFNEYQPSDVTISDVVKIEGLEKRIEWVDRKNINLSASIGQVVDLTPESVNTYEYMVTAISEGDILILTAKGGSSPRAYGFLDSENRLLEKAAVEATFENEKIVAPKNTAKVVVNNLRAFTKREVFVQSSDGVSSASQTSDFDPLTKFKDVGDTFRNSIAIASGAKYPISSYSTINDTQTEKACHVASFVVVGSTMYYAYYCNYINPDEEPTEQTARFGIADLQGNVSSIIDVVSVGDTVLGNEVTHLSDIVVLKEDDESDELHLLVTLCINDEWCVVHYLYTISTSSLGSPTECTFSGNGVSDNLDYSGVKAVLETFGPTNIRNWTIQIMPKVSSRTEGEDLYYYTGIGVVETCFLAKTTDFVNWEYVSTPDFDYIPRFEPATIIRGDYVYWFCRQNDSQPSCALSRYNLLTHTWEKPIFFGDCQSRPDFFVLWNELYLIHAPMNRNFLCVELMNETYNCKSYPWKLFYNEKTFYPFVQVVNNHAYCVATYNRKEIRFFEIPMGRITDSDYVDAVAQIF